MSYYPIDKTSVIVARPIKSQRLMIERAQRKNASELKNIGILKNKVKKIKEDIKLNKRG
jgi:hypothetical protein